MSLELKFKKTLALFILFGLQSCAQLPAPYKAMESGGLDVVAYQCVNQDGEGVGKAYFHKKQGLAMMILDIGLDLTGKALSLGPIMVGEVFFGKARVEFKIPHQGGPSEITMFPAQSDDPDDTPPRPQKKEGQCTPIPFENLDLDALNTFSHP